MQHLGEIICRRRLRAGLTQAELAEECEVTINYISMLENGRRGPSLAMLVKIGQALGARPSALLRQAEDLEGKC